MKTSNNAKKTTNGHLFGFLPHSILLFLIVAVLFYIGSQEIKNPFKKSDEVRVIVHRYEDLSKEWQKKAKKNKADLLRNQKKLELLDKEIVFLKKRNENQIAFDGREIAAAIQQKVSVMAKELYEKGNAIFSRLKSLKKRLDWLEEKTDEQPFAPPK